MVIIIQGNTGQFQLTPDQVKAYLKNPALQIKDGNWGNDFTSYNWTSTVGDLGMYLALAKARDEADVATYMDALTPSEASMTSFMAIIDSFFVQGAKVFNNLVSGALDFTLDKFTDFVEKTIDVENDSIRLQTTLEGLPVTTTTTVELDGKTYELKTTKGFEWLLQPWSDMNVRVEESGEFTYAITGGPDAARFVINETGNISFKDTAPVSASSGSSDSSSTVAVTSASSGPGASTDGTGDIYNPNNIKFDDANTDGTYLITVTITQGDFSQEYDIELAFPDWPDGDRNINQSYSELGSDQYVIEINEHSSTLRDYYQGTVVASTDYETIVVTVVNNGDGNQYNFNLNDAPWDGVFEIGTTYLFDQTDSSNSGHPLKLSETLDGVNGGGTEYTTGVETYGTPGINTVNQTGTDGAWTKISVTTDTPASLYVYCEIHNGMGGEVTSEVASIGNEGLILAGQIINVTDFIGGQEGTYTAPGGSVTPYPPGMGSDDWPQVMSFFGIDPVYGQSIVQPILMGNFGLAYDAPLSDLINTINNLYGQGTLAITDAKTSDPAVVGEFQYYSYFSVINYDNLSNNFSDTPSGNSPSIAYLFESIPPAGSGSFTLNLDLNNGRDYFKADFVNNSGFFVEATENISSSINVNWTSDGTNLTIEIPDQTLTVTRTDIDGNTTTSTWENVNKSVLSTENVISENGDAGVELNFELASLFTGVGTNSGTSLADYIQNDSHYSLSIEMEGAPFTMYTGTETDTFTFLFDTASNKTVLSAETVVVNEADGVANIKVTLSNPLEEDFTLEYTTLDGDQFVVYRDAWDGEDYFGESGSIFIPAGTTEASIQITILKDFENEPTESLTVQFPQFQQQGADGLNITTSGDVSWGGSTNGTLVLIENQEVTSTEYNGLELVVANAPSPDQGYIDIRGYDNEGNPIKDNELFRVQSDNDTGKYYLVTREGTLDFDNPQDRDGDNVYEISLTIVKFGRDGGESIATTQDMLVVVRDGPDPELKFGFGGDTFYQSESGAPVASVQDIEVNGKTVQAYFASGRSMQVNINTWEETILDDSGTPESILIFPYDSPATYSLTGGADSAQFVVINGELMFTERPVFDAPVDADGDNIYEVEVTASASGTTISKLFKVEIRPTEGDGVPLDPPAKLPVYFLKEIAETIGDTEAPKNLTGGEGDDYIQVSPDRFQYIHGGDGDDVLNPARDWGGHGHLTGGNGSDIFLFKANYMSDPSNFGIRDNSQQYSEGAPEGINGYDENRDGVLDLSSEINWSWVPLVADFTPGVDKIGLAVGGDNGFNRPDFSLNDIAFVQGTGDMAAHTLVLFTGEEASNRGYENGVGILGVLLDLDASTIDKATDVISVGAQYEAQLGKIDIGATTVEILDTDGNPVKVQQLPNGDYVWFDANYSKADNQVLHQVFTVSTDGFIYSGRASYIDFENPRDC